MGLPTSLALTTLPWFSSTLPVRPPMGARISVQLICTPTFSPPPSSPPTRPFALPPPPPAHLGLHAAGGEGRPAAEGPALGGPVAPRPLRARPGPRGGRALGGGGIGGLAPPRGRGPGQPQRGQQRLQARPPAAGRFGPS